LLAWLKLPPATQFPLGDAAGGFAVSTTFGHPVFLPDEDEFRGLPCAWRLEARDREGRSAVDEKTIVPTRM
jgi:hypothetical protein